MAGRPLKVLTDTHTLVWALASPHKLSSNAQKAVTEGKVTASVANLWELVIKMCKKGALVGEPLSWWRMYVLDARIPTLGIGAAHVMVLAELPDIHKDPFDRILVAQAIVERAHIVSKDSRLAEYGVQVIW